VVSYLGLNPAEHSSGGRQRLGSISKQGNAMLRSLLVEAGQSAARLVPELKRAYQRLKHRKHSSVAKVMVARKLAVRLNGRPASPKKSGSLNEQSCSEVQTE
jgi:transposase